MESSTKKISNLVLHSVTGGIDDSFIGLKLQNNDMHLYYPECYAIDETSDSIRNDIVDLLYTISIAKTTSNEHSKAYNTHYSDGDFALFSYIWMINDYLANGFYVNREKVYKINQSGKINWKKTMQSDSIVSGRSIIFPNVTVERTSSIDNLLVEIHRYCVKKSIDYIGWLFNLRSDFIETKPFNQTVKQLYLDTIRQELEQTFIDEKKLLLVHMKNVITGLDECSDNKDFVYGVDTYYYIFERMIDSIFGNVDKISRFYPTAKWQLVRNDYVETESSKLRPDTIIIDAPNAYILDSKFYRFGYTGDERDLPETTSIQKQITYGDYIKKNIKLNADMSFSSIYNAFLIPYDKNRDVFKSDDDLQYVGFAKSTWKNNDSSHEIVHTFLIDLKHVIKTWNKASHSDDVAVLIKEVIKNQEIAEKKLRGSEA